MWGKGENGLKGMGHYREVGWGWGKGFMSLASASLRPPPPMRRRGATREPISKGWGWGWGGVALGNHEGVELRGHPPLDPSTPLPPRRIYDTVGGPSQGMDSGSGAGMTGETGVGWG